MSNLGRATCTVHLISAPRPARKETNVPLHKRSYLRAYCPNIYTVTPGEYVTTVKIPNSDQNAQEVLVDYFVLIPQEYYEPRILKQDVYAPCLAGQTLPYCRHYSYPDLAAFPKTYGNVN